MKYVIVDREDVGTFPMIFPGVVNHNTMTDGHKVISAGQVWKRDVEFELQHGSETLNIERDEIQEKVDEQIFNAFFKF